MGATVARRPTKPSAPTGRARLLIVPLVLAVGLVGWIFFGKAIGSAIGVGGGDGSDSQEGRGGETGDADSATLVGIPGGIKPPEKPAEEEEEAKPLCSKPEGVFGRVIDAKEKPVPASKVTLFQVDANYWWTPKEGTPLASVEVAKDGTYLVGPAPPGVRLKVKAEAPGYASTLQAVASRGARIDLILDRAGSLKVKVTDRKAAAIAGAEVRVTSSAGWVQSSAAGKTGESGEAVVEGLPSGPAEVRVSATGYGAQNLGNVVLQPGKVESRSVVLGRALAVEGRVVDDANDGPVEGAEVWAKAGWEPDAPRTDVVKSDADGRFKIEAAGGTGEWLQVSAKKEGFAEATTGIQLQNGQAPQELAIRLGKGGQVKGTVLDADGRPAAGARVIYANIGWGSKDSQRSATADAEGEFALDLPSGAPKEWNYTVAASAPGKGMGAEQASHSQPRGPTIRLSGAGTVTGKVSSPEGQGLEGASVSLQHDWNSKMLPGTFPAGVPQWVYRQLFWDPRILNLAVTTDTTGAFRFDDVPIGAYRTEASWGLERGTASETVTVRAGSTETLKLEIASGNTIEGKVMDQDGNPVYGAFVNGWDPQNRRPNQTAWAYGRTDADGRFVMRGAVGGPWTLNVSAAGFAFKTVNGIAAGDKSVEVRLVPLGWIEGVVTAEGSPFTGAFTVSIQSTSPQRGGGNDMRFVGMGGMEWGGGREETFASADGTWLLRGVGAGSWRVNVTTQDGWIPAATPEVSVSDGRGAGPVEIRLQRGASVVGRVAEEGSRAPISGATVNLRIRGQATSGGQTWSWSQTDAKGTWSAQGMAAGTYVVAVQTTTGFQVEDEIRLEVGQTAQKDVLLAKWGSIRVVVVDSAGTGVANANVNLMTERGTWIQPNWDLLRKEGLVDWSRGNAWQKVMQTDASGVNVRMHVPPGRVQVSVNLPQGGKQPPVTWAVVESERTTDVTITLPAADASDEEKPGGSPVDCGGGKCG